MEDLDPTAQLVVDGALLQCLPWKNHPELDLRQAQDHRTQCAQVTCAPRAAWPGSVTPQDGRVHDIEDLRRTGRPGLRAVPGRPGTTVGRRPRWLVQRLHRAPKAPEMSCFRDVMVAGIV